MVASILVVGSALRDPTMNDEDVSMTQPDEFEVRIDIRVKVTDEEALRAHWLMTVTDENGGEALFTQSIERELATDIMPLLIQAVEAKSRGYRIVGMQGGKPDAAR